MLGDLLGRADLLLTARTGRQISLTRDLARRYEDVGVRLLVADIDYRRVTLPEALSQAEKLAAELRLTRAAV